MKSNKQADGTLDMAFQYQKSYPTQVIDGYVWRLLYKSITKKLELGYNYIF